VAQLLSSSSGTGWSCDLVRLQGEDKLDAERRMAEINETLEKLIALAKKRKYISADNTVASLRLEAEKKVQESAAKTTIAKMTQMKGRLDAQSAAVRLCSHELLYFRWSCVQVSVRKAGHHDTRVPVEDKTLYIPTGAFLWDACSEHRMLVQVATFLKDRQDKDAAWEQKEWQKLLRSNQATLMLMQRLSDKGLVTDEMLKMAALPHVPPPRRNGAPQAVEESVSLPIDPASEIQRHPQQPGAHAQQPQASAAGTPASATPPMQHMHGQMGVPPSWKLDLQHALEANHCASMFNSTSACYFVW
jgi:hypothetical protein